jgi:hypothetical protein
VPFIAARCRGVLPYLSAALTSAPISIGIKLYLDVNFLKIINKLKNLFI